MRSSALLMAVLAMAVFAASPATPAKAKHSVSCKQIKDAIAAGKSADEVAKDLKTTDKHVKSCTTPTAKHHSGSHAAAK